MIFFNYSCRNPAEEERRREEMLVESTLKEVSLLFRYETGTTLFGGVGRRSASHKNRGIPIPSNPPPRASAF